MVTAVLFTFADFAVPPLTVLGMFRILRRPAGSRFCACWAADALLTMAGVLAAGLGPGGAWPSGASGVIALVLWWWSRRKKRKRAARPAGAKARARLAAMAKGMPKPGRVPRPVPQGA